MPPLPVSAVLAQSSQARETAAATSPVWRSEEILHGEREVLIQHGQETYRLRLTRAGKLILYK